MIGRKITELTETTTTDELDIIPIVQSSQTKRITFGNLLSKFLRKASNLSDVDDVEQARANLEVKSGFEITNQIETTVNTVVNTEIQNAITSTILPAINAAVAKKLDYQTIIDLLAGVFVFTTPSLVTNDVLLVEDYQNIILIRDIFDNTKTHRIALPSPTDHNNRWIIISAGRNVPLSQIKIDCPTDGAVFIVGINSGLYWGLDANGSLDAWTDANYTTTIPDVIANYLKFEKSISLYSNGTYWFVERYRAVQDAINIPKI